MDSAERIGALKQHAKRQQLVVLVWGPGDPGAGASKTDRKYWQKREQIRDALKAEFVESEILFSETEALRDHTRGPKYEHA